MTFLALTYAKGQGYKNSIQAITENDAYIDITKDRYYTNGIFLKYTHAVKQDSSSKRLLHINLEQKIFNPYYSTAPDPQLHDRPFTAFLYGEIGVTKFQKHHLLRYSGKIGLTGNKALGETFQKFYHNLVGQNKVEGWDYALKADLGVGVTASYTYNIWSLRQKWLDLYAETAIDIGTFSTTASLSPIIRFGKINGMHQSAAFNSRLNTDSKKVPYELFLYIKPKTNFVGFDARLQGGFFRREKGSVTYNPKPWVFTTNVGATFAIQRWALNYNVTLTSKEVKHSPAPSYKYAAISATYCFN